MFVVFSFEHEGTVEVVPMRWCPDETSCYWPPSNLQNEITSLITKCASYSENWTLYKGKILYKSMIYSRDREQLNKAEMTSDLASEAEYGRGKRLKRQRQMENIISSGPSSSSDESGKSEKNHRRNNKGKMIKLPSPPSLPSMENLKATCETVGKEKEFVSTTSKKPLSKTPVLSAVFPSLIPTVNKPISSQISRTFEQQPSKKNIPSLKQSKAKPGNEPSSQTSISSDFYTKRPSVLQRSESPSHSPLQNQNSFSEGLQRSESPCHSLQNQNSFFEGASNRVALYDISGNSSNMGTLNCDASFRNENYHSHLPSHRPQNLGDKKQKFEKTVMYMLSDINMKVEKILRAQQQITHLASEDFEIEGLPDLPLTTVNHVEILEGLLQNDDIKKRVVKKLAAIGGRKVGDTCRSVLKQVFSHSLILKFNWIGIHEKLPFKILKIKDVIVEAVQLNIKGARVYDIEAVIKKWIRYSGDREGGRAKREKRNDNDSDITNEIV